MDTRASDPVAAEIWPQEELLWEGRPDPATWFNVYDALLVPVSLAWGGVACLWEASALGWTSRTQAPDWVGFSGIPLVALGAYMIAGRFAYKAWMRRRTWYAVTTLRVLVVERGLRHRTTMAFHKTIPAVVRRERHLIFGRVPFVAEAIMNSGLDLLPKVTSAGIVAFFDLADADAVERLVESRRAKGT